MPIFCTPITLGGVLQGPPTVLSCASEHGVRGLFALHATGRNSARCPKQSFQTLVNVTQHVAAAASVCPLLLPSNMLSVCEIVRPAHVMLALNFRSSSLSGLAVTSCVSGWLGDSWSQLWQRKRRQLIWKITKRGYSGKAWWLWFIDTNKSDFD